MSVTISELNKQQFKCIEYEVEKMVLHVNASDMSRFMLQEKELANKIGKIKLRYEIEHGLKPMPAYERLEEQCQISVSTMKNTINGKIKPTRNFLYKFTVGLKMTLESANELFVLCGGPLSQECKADYICIKALGKDDIYHFIDQFQEYTKMKIELRNRNHSENKMEETLV